MEQEAAGIENIVSEISRAYGVSTACGHDVFYLRTRSRWTQELEAELIALHQNGTPPNVMEFGVSEESHNAMYELIESVKNSLS